MGREEAEACGYRCEDIRDFVEIIHQRDLTLFERIRLELAAIPREAVLLAGSTKK
jgi:hypothetical protein